MVPPVTVYWRPGCPYCRRLRGDLRRIGLPAREANIWEDPAAAACVRAAAGGNETVPTVTVGERALVNPPVSAVVGELRRADAAHGDYGALARSARRVRVLRAGRWALLAALIAASYAIEDTGHPGASWVFDGVAAAVWVTVYLVSRLARRRAARRTPLEG